MNPDTPQPKQTPQLLTLMTKRRSIDGSIKFLWQLPTGENIESVYLPLMNRGAQGPSLCISSQVGCAVRCTFCATGQNGLTKNLTADEIAAQVTATFAETGPAPAAFDVSFMGMGEPLHNLDAVKAAMHLVHDRYAPAAEVHFSLSTIGIAKRLYELADFDLPVALQVSLHGPTDAIREQLIPTKARGSISDLLTAIGHYTTKHRSEVNINYLLFDGINDTSECAVRLVELLTDQPGVRLKLSHYNSIEGSDLNPTSAARKRRFMELCRDHGFEVFDWSSIGVDIAGGCGQLRSSVESAGSQPPPVKTGPGASNRGSHAPAP